MITTMSTPLGGSDIAKVRVYSLDRFARRRDREDIAIQCWIKVHQRSGYLIVVLDGMSQAHGRRSEVAHRQGHAPGELALDIQIPLQPVSATGIEFHMFHLKRGGSQQLCDLVRKAGRWR